VTLTLAVHVDLELAAGAELLALEVDQGLGVDLP
jgi:hypothetical protein